MSNVGVLKVIQQQKWPNLLLAKYIDKNGILAEVSYVFKDIPREITEDVSKSSCSDLQ